MSRLSLFALSALMLLTLGCHRSQVAKVPKDALRNVFDAIEKNNRELFMNSVFYNPMEDEFASSSFEMMSTAYQYNKDMTSTYGKRPDNYISCNLPLLSKDELNNLIIEEDGDRATARTPGVMPVQLICINETWFIDLSKDAPKGAAYERTVLTNRALTRTLNDLRQKIGRPDYSVVRINQEFQAMMTNALRQTVAGATTSSAPAPK